MLKKLTCVLLLCNICFGAINDVEFSYYTIGTKCGNFIDHDFECIVYNCLGDIVYFNIKSRNDRFQYQLTNPYDNGVVRCHVFEQWIRDGLIRDIRR